MVLSRAAILSSRGERCESCGRGGSGGVNCLAVTFAPSDSPRDAIARNPCGGDPAAAGGGARGAAYRLACVSYLNAKPLLAGLDDDPAVALRLDVPARLGDRLEAGEADAALLPVFDLFESSGDAAAGLTLLPAGGIGCDGPTLTVQLFSRAPIDAVRRVALDTDSHTSVALLKVLLAWRGIEPDYVPWTVAGGGEAAGAVLPAAGDADAVLLIGDKVVTARPDDAAFPHRMDLGEAWREATGLPFVFAAWVARTGIDHAALSARLAAARARGEAEAHALADRHAPAHGWPRDLARRYLGSILQYRIGPRQVEAIERFGRACRERGLTRWRGPLRLSGSPVSA